MDRLRIITILIIIGCVAVANVDGKKRGRVLDTTLNYVVCLLKLKWIFMTILRKVSMQMLEEKQNFLKEVEEEVEIRTTMIPTNVLSTGETILRKIHEDAVIPIQMPRPTLKVGKRGFSWETLQRCL